MMLLLSLSLAMAGTVKHAVADCGAVGDGVTDDTPALQACLDTADTVVLEPGTYRVKRTTKACGLRVRDGDTLIGAHRGTAVLLSDPANTESAFRTVCVEGANTAVKDLILDGGQPHCNASGAEREHHAGIFVNAPMLRGHVISGIQCRGAYDGDCVVGYRGLGIRITDSELSGSCRAGLVVNSGAAADQVVDGLQVAGNVFEGHPSSTKYRAIDIEPNGPVRNVSITGNVADHIACALCVGFTISGNTISDELHLHGADDGTVAGNWIQGQGTLYASIHASKTRRLVITGNRIDVTDPWRDGVRVSYHGRPAEDVVIAGNQIRYAGTEPVLVGQGLFLEGASGAVVTGNHVAGFLDGVKVMGGVAIVHDNRLEATRNGIFVGWHPSYPQYQTQSLSVQGNTIAAGDVAIRIGGPITEAATVCANTLLSGGYQAPAGLVLGECGPPAVP